MNGKPSKTRLWNLVYAALFTVIGAACLWLSIRREYGFSIMAWGLCWLVLAAGMLWAALRKRWGDKDLQPLGAGLAYALIGGPHLELGLRTGSGFHMGAGVCWMLLAAAWLARALRNERKESS